VHKQITERETINNCRYDPGDFALAVQWHDRDPADPSGRTFVAAEKGLLNSSELRMHGFEMSTITISNSQQIGLSGGECSGTDSEDDDMPLGIVINDTNDQISALQSGFEHYEIAVKIEQSILSKCW
jgi:hypothetical protein